MLSITRILKQGNRISYHFLSRTQKFAFCVNGHKSQGKVDPKFNKIAALFEHDLNNGYQYGGSLCIIQNDKIVLDIYGGYHGDNKTKWEKDTYSHVHSPPYGLMSILHQQQQGLLNINDKISKYWPEFAQNGKQDLRIRDFLLHRTGVVIVPNVTGITGQPPKYDDMIKNMALMKGDFNDKPPGSAQAYHTFTIGYFCNEITQRVSGMGVHDYFERNIKNPLQITNDGGQLAICLNKEQYTSKLMSTLQFDEDNPFNVVLNDPESPIHQAWKPFNNVTLYHDTPAYYEWNIPNTGFGNARGLAVMGNCILNNKKHQRIIGNEMRDGMLNIVNSEFDELFGYRVPLSLTHSGARVDDDNEEENENVYHFIDGTGVVSLGAGQSFGLIHPMSNSSIAYVPSRALPGLGDYGEFIQGICGELRNIL